MSVKKGENYSHLIYNLFSLSKMSRKTFSWRQVEYEIKGKYLENLVFEKFCNLNDVK